MKIAQIQNTSNPSFKMNVQFKYPEEMDKFLMSKLPKKAISDYPYDISTPAKGVKLFTQHCADCSIIGITNGEKAVMRHLIPICKNLTGMGDFTKTAKLKKQLLLQMEKELEGLKKSGGKLSAFLIGGQPIEVSQTRSLSLMHNLLQFFQKHEIKPTIIWGQQGGSLDALYSVKGDKLTIFPSQITQITPKSLRDNFSFMNFNNADKVFMPNGKEAKTSYLTKNEKSSTSIKRTNSGKEAVFY